MAFWICGATTNHTIDLSTEQRLLPGPTYPEYGDRFKYSLHDTDAAPVLQRQKRHTSEAKWVWENYSPIIPRYEDLYWMLFNEQAHIRAEQGKSPYVYLREDVTTNLGKFNPTTNRIEPGYVRCLITYVGRTEDKSGGNIIYATTEMRFVVDDPTISELV